MNIIILAILNIFLISVLKFLFPVMKEMRIGTEDFYPNLLRKNRESFEFSFLLQKLCPSVISTKGKYDL
ncbi:hypothetical protein SAMN05443633_102423 [Chryseobacterium arachidis]|uniref:Uncharacterized protein n=1 Tax=Chryseobacterium arachidis TaxID=1416778 RepID=A0A1M4XTF5_9FLAO|nr:hypothetical protein SAMN05443633_102423 [Chryseobacterium arachidis]